MLPTSAKQTLYNGNGFIDKERNIIVKPRFYYVKHETLNVEQQQSLPQPKLLLLPIMQIKPMIMLRYARRSCTLREL